jgi:hypothetical protein
MNEIVKSNNVINSMEDVERAARAMSASGFFPDSKQAAQAIVKVLAGRELGFGAFASMTGVAVIQGKPVIGANLLAAAVKQTGKYNYRVTEHTDQICRIKFFEAGQEVGVSTFTMDDARAAGLTNKDNWKKYPRNMLFARAIANGQKWYAPDVFNGVTVYTPDEMGATVDDDGNIIEAVTETAQVAHKAPPSREKLIERYTDRLARAAALGINTQEWELTETMPDEEIIKLGTALNAEIVKKENNNA